MPSRCHSNQLRRIFFEKLTVEAFIGVLPHERQTAQPLIIDAAFDVAVRQALSDDDIRTVLDYRALRLHIIDHCQQGHTNLLESLAETLMDSLFTDYPDVQRIRLRLAKPQAFEDCAAVGIELCRQRNT